MASCRLQRQQMPEQRALAAYAVCARDWIHVHTVLLQGTNGSKQELSLPDNLHCVGLIHTYIHTYLDTYINTNIHT